MNRALYGKSYKIPQHIIEKIRAKLYTATETGGDGVKRAKYIMNNGQCTYQMLKRLKNFFDYCDVTNPQQLEQYELAGGNEMKSFVERTLQSERNLVSTRKNTNVMFMPSTDQRSLTPDSGKVDLSVNENVEVGDLGGLNINALSIIFDHGNGNPKVLLLKRSDREIWMPRKWALVGGKVEEGETPLQGAIREVFEETKLRIDEYIGYYVIRSGKDHVEYVYVTTIEGQPEVVLNDEHLEYGWFSPEEIKYLDRVPHLDDLVALGLQKLQVWDFDEFDDTNDDSIYV